MVRFTTSSVMVTVALCGSVATRGTAFIVPPATSCFGQRISCTMEVVVGGGGATELDSKSWRSNRIQQRLQMQMSAANKDESSGASSSSASSSASAAAAADEEEGEKEEEFHPSNPARTTTQFLSGLWQLIAQGNNLVRGVSVKEKRSWMLLFDTRLTFSLCFQIDMLGIAYRTLSQYGTGIYSSLFEFGHGPFGFL